jgi:DNA-binding transcriptional regulator GbsR (MarR family)
MTRPAAKTAAAVSKPAADPVVTARRALLEGVGQEVAASFPGITRLGGQIVAALYLADSKNADAFGPAGPGDTGRSMDELSAELGRSKSNIFANLRALEAAGIVERRRSAGARHDRFALRGPYPDVMIGAYIARLRRIVADKRALVERSLGLLGDARGEEADLLRSKLNELGRKYGLFGEVFQRVGASLDVPIDLEPLLREIPPEFLDLIAEMLTKAATKPRA